MKAKAAAQVFCTFCLLVPASDAFASPPSHIAGVVGGYSQHNRHQLNILEHLHRGTYKRFHGAIASRSRDFMVKYLSTNGDRVGALGSAVRRPRTRSRPQRKIVSTSAFSEEGSAFGSNETVRPSGPGAGVINLHFRYMKSGGFKVFLLFFLLGQARAQDNESPFSIRETLDGIRVLIGDESKNESQWEGVLDLTWGTEPQPFFRVDRIDVNEVVPYPGELYILNKLLDAIIDVNGERSVDDAQKLFLFHPGGQSQLADTKAKLSYLASL